MAPGWSSYHNRLQFQSYDITEMLEATNLVEMSVADGWFKGPYGFIMQKNIYGDRVGAFVELHIFYEDGSMSVVATDESWKVRTGKITSSQIYLGENVDTTIDEYTEYKVTLKDFDKTAEPYRCC